jgi:Flp pilus assembly protein TadB
LHRQLAAATRRPPTERFKPSAEQDRRGRRRQAAGGTRRAHHLVGRESEVAMLWTLAVILMVLWALGLVTSYTMGGFIHILLVLALIVLVFRLIQGRRVA